MPGRSETPCSSQPHIPVTSFYRYHDPLLVMPSQTTSLIIKHMRNSPLPRSSLLEMQQYYPINTTHDILLGKKTHASLLIAHLPIARDRPFAFARAPKSLTSSNPRGCEDIRPMNIGSSPPHASSTDNQGSSQFIHLPSNLVVVFCNFN